MLTSKVDEISLVDVWLEIYRKKFIIIFISFVFAALSVFIALSLPNQYRASALLLPIKADEGGLASLAKNLGGLAGMAGIKLGRKRGPDNTDIALEIMKSQQFINDFVSNNDLAVPLMAVSESKPITFELIINDAIYDEKNKKWVRDVKAPKKPEPSPEEIKNAFLNILEVEIVPKSGFVIVSIEYYSPFLAQKWVGLLVKAINSQIRDNDKSEAERSIDYLNKSLEKTNNSNMKETFYQLIEEQTKTLMLAESRQEYVLKTISTATVPETKSKPKRALIVIAGAIFGGLFAVIWCVIRFFRKAL